MKRYVLFAGEAHYPAGGWQDFIATSDDLAPLKAMIKWDVYNPDEDIVYARTHCSKRLSDVEKMEEQVARLESWRGRDSDFRIVREGEEDCRIDWWHITDMETLEVVAE